MIIHARIATPDQLHQAGPQIEHEEKHAPPLILSNMNLLVGTNPPQDGMINPDDHMPKGYGDKPQRKRKERNDPIDPATGNLHHSVNKMNRSSCAHCNR